LTCCTAVVIYIFRAGISLHYSKYFVNTTNRNQIIFKIIYTLDYNLCLVSSIVFLSDEKLFILASNNRTIRLWYINKTLQQTLNGHYKPVNYIIFLPNGNLLISALNNEKTFQLWNINNKIMQKEFVNYFNPIVFSPNGTIQTLHLANGNVEL